MYACMHVCICVKIYTHRELSLIVSCSVVVPCGTSHHALLYGRQQIP